MSLFLFSINYSKKVILICRYITERVQRFDAFSISKYTHLLIDPMINDNHWEYPSLQSIMRLSSCCCYCRSVHVIAIGFDGQQKRSLLLTSTTTSEHYCKQCSTTRLFRNSDKTNWIQTSIEANDSESHFTFDIQNALRFLILR